MAEMHDTALRRGPVGCHDWAELENTARKKIKSNPELADGVETA